MRAANEQLKQILAVLCLIAPVHVLALPTLVAEMVMFPPPGRTTPSLTKANERSKFHSAWDGQHFPGSMATPLVRHRADAESQPCSWSSSLMTEVTFSMHPFS